MQPKNVKIITIPKPAQRWVIRKILGSGVIPFINEAINFDIMFTDGLFRLSIETLTYNINLSQRASNFKLLVNITISKKNSGKKRVGFYETKFDPNFFITNDSRPYCSICNRLLNVNVLSARTTVTPVYNGYSQGNELFERGHEKHHQKIGAEIRKLKDVAGRVRMLLNLQQLNCYTYITSLTFWMSRWTLLCIWFLRKNENVNRLPRDVFLLIAKLIYSE
jgi:hypothetical protein